MEKEERNSTNMTVGVVLTVAVAILLLVAMIPAMMPAQEGGDDGPAPYVTSVEINSYHTIITLKSGDTTLATLEVDGSYWTAFLDVPGYILMFESQDHYGSVAATADSTITGQYSGLSAFDFVATTPAELADSSMFNHTTQYSESPVITNYTISPTAPANTPDIATLLWEAMFLNTSYGPGFDPEHPPSPSGGGVDTNTVLIGAIISLMFISIALVAVRSFRA